MFTVMSVRKEARVPAAYSVPAYVNDKGRNQEAQIVINMFGIPEVGDPPTTPSADLTVFLSLDEAEALATHLAGVVAAAREGNFSAMGEELAGRRETSDGEP